MRRRHLNEVVTNTDIKILSYLAPCTEKQFIKYGSDSYFCYASKHLRRDTLTNRVNKVKSWVERNGGIFKLISADLEDVDNWYYEIQGDNHGVYVQIRFPQGCKRNMKEIMSVLYDPADVLYV